jgi:hypothetical protein
LALVAGVDAAVLAHGGTAGLAAELGAVLVGVIVLGGALYVLGRKKIDEYAVHEPRDQETGAASNSHNDEAARR